jgi:predicted DNA-binding transcriptional regulator AlpA
VSERRGPVLNTRRAAEYCGIAVQTLYNELSNGNGPELHKQGRLNAFYPADLDAWLATRVTASNRDQAVRDESGAERAA